MQQTSTKRGTRYDWMGKGIHWELCKRLKFNPTNKWYMHKMKSAQKNEAHKFLETLRYK